jgi:ParB family chromosome partitioning protein
MTSIRELKGKTHMEGEMETVILKKLEGEFADLESLAQANADILMVLLDIDPDSKDGKMLADDIIIKASDIVADKRMANADAKFNTDKPIPEVPFKAQFKKQLANGEKTRTTRTEKIGEVGTEFKAYGMVFELMEVDKKPFKVIVASYYREEGFKTPEDFIMMWKTIHPKKYKDTDEFWCHKFKFKRFLPIPDAKSTEDYDEAMKLLEEKRAKDEVKVKVKPVKNPKHKTPPATAPLPPSKPTSLINPTQSTFDWDWDKAKKIAAKRIDFIELSKIQPNPWNPNRMDKDTYESTKADMLAQGPDQYMDPIQVREVKGTYQIIDGEHRWKIATELGWERIKAEIYSMDEATAINICYKKNRNRGTLDPHLEASLFKKLLDEGQIQQKELAKRMGVSESHISRTLGLLRMPEGIKDKAKELPIAVQEKIASIKEPEAQAKALDRVLEGNGTVEEATKVIDQVKSTQKSKALEFDNTFAIDDDIPNMLLVMLSKASQHPSDLLYLSMNGYEIDVSLDGIHIQPSDKLFNIDILSEDGKALKATVNKAKSVEDVQKAKDMIEQMMGGSR